MRLVPLLVLVAALAGCSFEEPPAPSGAGRETPAAIPSAADIADPCTNFAVTLLDGLLNGLPSADPQTIDKAGRVADQFQQRYDAVIASSGVEAARAQYTDEIAAACAA